MKDMTLSEAAYILGIGTRASKKEISDAARELMAKYHPDAQQGKNDTDKNNAAKMFKLVTNAKRIMLNPQLAAPEKTPPRAANASRPQFRQQTSQQEKPRPHTSSQSNESDAVYHEKVIESKHGTGVGSKTVDAQEQQLELEIEKEISKRYKEKTDILRATPSMLSSIIMFCLSIVLLISYGLFQYLFSNPSGFFAIPATIVALVSIVKIPVYDLFISYFVHERARLSWIGMISIEISAISLLGLFLMQDIFFMPFAVPFIIGIAACVVSQILSKNK